MVFCSYIVSVTEMFLESPAQALPKIALVVAMLYLNYRSRRVFTWKGRINLRPMALLPIACEVGSMALKVRVARGLLQIPMQVYPQLTVKPPMTFVLFVALALFVKTRELRYCRHGKTHEEYRAFLRTRRNSWNFSVSLIIMLVIVSIVDPALVTSIIVNFCGELKKYRRGDAPE